MTHFAITDYVDEDRQVVAEIYHGDEDEPVRLVGRAGLKVAIEAGVMRARGEEALQAFLAGAYFAHAPEREFGVRL